MRIPKYWAHGKYLLRDKYPFFAWRWSDTSFEEAQQLANDKAREIALKFQNGQRLDRYTYDRNPIREEIIQSIKSDNGKELGIITRNTYGALVLTNGIQFVCRRVSSAIFRRLSRIESF